MTTTCLGGVHPAFFLFVYDTMPQLVILNGAERSEESQRSLHYLPQLRFFAEFILSREKGPE